MYTLRRPALLKSCPESSAEGTSDDVLAPAAPRPLTHVDPEAPALAQGLSVGRGGIRRPAGPAATLLWPLCSSPIPSSSRAGSAAVSMSISTRDAEAEAVAGASLAAAPERNRARSRRFPFANTLRSTRDGIPGWKGHPSPSEVVANVRRPTPPPRLPDDDDGDSDSPAAPLPAPAPPALCC